VRLLNLSKRYTHRDGLKAVAKKKMAGDFGHRPFSVAGRSVLPAINKTIFPAFHRREIGTFFEV
jgi:hypothetical protein